MDLFLDTFFNWQIVQDASPILWMGFKATLLLSALVVPLGILGGIILAVLATVQSPWVKWPLRVWVDTFRALPPLVLLVFIFAGLPAAGVKLSPEAASVLAMVINLGAYATEILRAGIEATPRGQIEAAQSLALSPRQTFMHVVLPPALRRVWPALVSQIIIVMLGSAVCGQISTEELSFAANLIQSRNFRAFEAFLIATALYLVLSVAVRRLLNWLGPRFLFGGR